MYLFYVDESGSRDPDCGLQPDGSCTKDWLYVVTAVGLYEGGWKKFYGKIVSRKRELLARLNSCHGLSLDLDVTEIKSNWIRIPKERAKHPFLSQLTDPDISALVALYFEQLAAQKMPVISVAIDKRKLRPPYSAAWLHAKAWEMLVERVEMFMWREHSKHSAVMIADDMGKSENVGLAMRHARFLERATSAGRQLKHIVEMPLFVRSELSEGVQLADLCGYSVYRALRHGDPNYEYFQLVQPQFIRGRKRKCHGLKIHPALSELNPISRWIDGEL
jgi:hypothetical protein